MPFQSDLHNGLYGNFFLSLKFVGIFKMSILNDVIDLLVIKNQKNELIIIDRFVFHCFLGNLKISV